MGLDRSSGGSSRTWRTDPELIERLGHHRRRRRSYDRSPGRVLLSRIPSSRLFRQLAASTAILIIIAAGLRLPFGAGDSLRDLLVRVFSSQTTLDGTAAAIRQLAEEGRRWAVSNIGDDSFESLPTVIPGTGSAGSRDLPSIQWVGPVDGPLLSPFGWRSGAAGDEEFHYGVDIGARPGAFVVAAGSGVVSRVGTTGDGRSSQVEIDHQNGWVTRYSLLGTVAVVEGETVAAGDIIGTVDGDQDPVRLHFEMLLDGRHVDPEPKIRRSGNEH